MSGVLLGTKPRHPEGKSLKDALSDDEPRLKAQKGLISKRATLIKATDEGGDADAGTGATMRPTDEQLGRINMFTKKKVTADEVVAFNTMSCNDIVDRDDDQFTTQCVKDFAALEQPFSPTGKSFMLDHSRSVTAAAGRIFGTDTKKAQGALFLTNEVYVPKTDQYKNFIENIDFGIAWAVSVGVMLGKSECSVCGKGFSSWGWWCSSGHDKGLWYDPKSEETDDWGYPLACEPGTKGAVKCVREFSDPIDMYELSQVFLGAQYFAELEKEPDFQAVMKSATTGDLPIIGLSAKEAEVIPLRHEPDKVSEARKLFKVSEAEDGSINWTDAQGIRWTFDPEVPEDGVQSFGRAADTDNEGDEADANEHTIPGEAGSDDQGDLSGDQAAVTDPESGLGGSGSGSNSSATGLNESSGESGDSSEGEPEVTPSDDEDEDEEDEDEEDSEEDDDEEKAALTSAVVEAAENAGLSEAVVNAVKGAKSNPLKALFSAVNKEVSELQQQVTALTEKAELGEQYVTDLRADAIAAYVRNNATKEEPKVSTEVFEKLLDKCGTDVELLKQMTEDQMKQARKKFPKSVRRSSFPTDPNSVTKLEDPDIGEVDSENDSKVKRLHG